VLGDFNGDAPFVVALEGRELLLQPGGRRKRLTGLAASLRLIRPESLAYFSPAALQIC